MKVLDAVREAHRNRMVVLDRIRVTSDVEPETPFIPDMYRVRFHLDVGVEVICPLEALPEVKDRAVLSIADELYGELFNDLMELRKRLYEDNVYRPDDDPVFQQLDKILKKTKGYT